MPKECGLGNDRSSQETTQAAWAEEGPSAARTYEENHKASYKKTKCELESKRKLRTSLKRQCVEKKRAAELERMLLPDAPPCQRSRKGSPKRVAFRLVPGTPPVPPSPKPRHWHKPEMDDFAVSSVPSWQPFDDQSEELQETRESTLERKPTPLMCDWTTRELSTHPPISELSASSGTGYREPSATVSWADLDVKFSTFESNCSSLQSDVQPLPSSSQPSQPSQMQSIHVIDLSTEDSVVLEWLDQLSDKEKVVETDDTEEFNINIDHGINYAAEDPAILPEDTDSPIGQWLTEQDLNADRTVTALLSDDMMTFDWNNDPNSFLGQREVFTGDSGPTFPILDSTRPIDVFLKFFDDEVFDCIVSETNRSIASISQPLQKCSRVRNCKRTDKNEMAVFIAVLIFQGACPLSVEKDYFRENGYLTLPYFKSLMTYNRLVILKKLLHFTDDTASTENMTTDQKKLRKLGRLLDLLNNKFSTLYLPSRDIAIDESLLKWRGYLRFAQKIATKAAKVGVKSYELCEASTGYLWKFLIYTGKGMLHRQTDDTGQTDRDEMQAPRSITAKIVDDLVQPLLNRGHTLTMNNFYNSPLLARYLKANKTDCLGTLRVNREFVPESIKNMAKSELRPGEIVYSYCRDLSILLWRDNNVVSVISTFHKGDIGGKEKYGKYRYKPQAVLDYNLTMGVVYKKDQLLSSHPIERTRNSKWYKKVFRRLLNVTILNAYIIFKTRFPNIMQRQFRIQLANELVKTFKTNIEVPRLTEVEKVRIIEARNFQRPILKGNHFIGLGQSKYKVCVWCKKARSKYICKQCDVSLCLDICFEEFHTKS